MDYEFKIPKGAVVLVTATLFINSAVFAKEYCITVPDEKVAIIETYVPDLHEWIEKAVEGKFNNRSEALFREELQYSLDIGSSLPKSKDDAIKRGMKRLGTRKERDAKEKTEREKLLNALPTATPTPQP